MAAHFPIGFRPKPSEARAIRRAMEELGINRSLLIRTALRDWLSDQQKKGTLSTGTASAFR